jgi:HAD superfamily hydrolase (TIGR01490 family)
VHRFSSSQLLAPLRRRRGGADDGKSAERTGAGAAAASAALQPKSKKDPPAPVDPGAAAFFDVDNTLMQGASLFHFARGMARRKFFTSRDLARFAWQQAVFRIVGSERDMTDTRESALAFIAGREMSEVVTLGEEIYDEIMAERIWAGTWALAERHLAAGQQVWLVTATPVELADVIARRLGLTGALGTVSEVDSEGRYTGRLVGEPLHGPVKAQAVRALASERGLDLSRCAAYSDSINDVPMLSLVGHPVAINPDGELRVTAKAEGWPIRDWRTGRKAAKIGVPAAAGVGAVGGGVVAGVALRRRHEGHGHPRRLRAAIRDLR